MWVDYVRVYFTQSVFKVVMQKSIQYKAVNLFFTEVKVRDKLTSL